MPRLTQTSAQARRDSITAAMIRVMSRNGVAHTSMADISEESGLSSGSIYSHFASKGEIAALAADAVVGRRAAAVFAQLDSRHPKPPLEVLALLLDEIAQQDVPLSVILQLWAEATIDPELHTVVDQAIAAIAAAGAKAILPWVHQSDPTLSDDAATAHAEEIGRSMTAIAQGYIARRALFADTPPFDEYARGLRLVFG